MFTTQSIDIPDDARKPAYLIVFERPIQTGEYSPFADPTNPSYLQAATAPHGLDRNLVTCLPALWYCLHLPATCFDLYDLNATALKRFQTLDLPHEIILAPFDRLTEILANLDSYLVPVFAFVSDALYAEAQRQLVDSEITIISNSDMLPRRLPELWTSVAIKMAITPIRSEPPAFCDRLDVAPLILPLVRLKRQFHTDSTIPYPSKKHHLEQLLDYGLRFHTVLGTTAALERDHVSPEDFHEAFETTSPREAAGLRLPITLAVPGLPNAFYKAIYPARAKSQSKHTWPAFSPNETFANLGTNASDHTAELSTIRFLAAHRACARNGLGLCLDSPSSEIFQQLTDLEDHFRGSNRKPKAIWKWMRKIGTSIGAQLGDLHSAALARATSIDAFANFPIGWTFLSGDSSPLCCRVPIAYRPLMPLTRALQAELSNPPIVYLGGSLKVLLVECVEVDDPIAAQSSSGMRFIRDMLAKNARINCELAYANSTAALRKAVESHQPAILLISAHGSYDRNAGLAGIKIGSEVCAGPELGPMPPLVILSACHVAPRGRGTINVAELLLIEGASAVLATQIPVQVRHNAILMTRFFVYIAEAMQRNSHGLHTIAQIWHHTATSNAVNDILCAHAGTESWARAEFLGRNVIDEFMSRRATGRLRLGHIYSDTETILIDIAKEDGIGPKLAHWLKHDSYVPESLFYYLIGWPDRVVMRHPMIPVDHDAT